MTARYRLERVGAGPGTAVFSCEQVLGTSVEVVDAADYDALVARVREALVYLSEDQPGTAALLLSCSVPKLRR